MNRRYAAIPLAVAITLAGCGAPRVTEPTAATAPVPDDAVGRAAALLAEADTPATSATRRATLVAALDRLGSAAQPDSEDDPLARWRIEGEAAGQAAVPDRGRALGPAYRSGWLEPGANKVLDQLFLAGQTARIALTSPDRQPIALTISDPASKVICRQDGPPPGRCQWVSVFTQRYRIELANRGQVRLRYFLVTN